MKTIRNLLTAATMLTACGTGTAHALVVDFESFAGTPTIQSNFLGGYLNYNDISSTLRLNNQFFGTLGGITFSGGVLVDGPTDSSAPPQPIMGDGGSVYYGTAFSPSTSITTSNYQNLLGINIANNERVSSVRGSFVHGLNTRDIDGDGVSVDYTVSYTLDGVASPVTQNFSAVFSDGADTVDFGFDSNTLTGATMGALITGVEIVADGYDFLNSGQNVDEFDFLLGAVRFNEGAGSPVPIPAALPLFISALMGGVVIARPKKKANS